MQLKTAVLRRAELIRHFNALLMASAPLKSLTSSANAMPNQETHGVMLFKTFVRELDSLYAKTDKLVEGVHCNVLSSK